MATTEAVTGLDVCIALVRMAVRGDPTATEVVHEHAFYWQASWPVIRHRILQDAAVWQLTPDDARARLDMLGIGVPQPRRPPRPGLPSGTSAKEVLRAAAQWAVTFADESVAVGAMMRLAAEHGINIDRQRALRVIQGMHSKSAA